MLVLETKIYLINNTLILFSYGLLLKELLFNPVVLVKDKLYELDI